MDSESSTKFIGSLTKFLQSLCNGYVEFEEGVELIGHIYLSVDAGKTSKKLNYFLNEKVCKNDNSVTFISNSFHAQPESKTKGGSGKEDGKKDDDVSDSAENVPRSTNTGTVPSRPPISSRSAPSPNQNRSGVHAGSKRPGSPLSAPTPPSQRRMQASSIRSSVGSPASKTVPSSPSSSSQDNIPSPSPGRKNRSETSQPPSNQSDNTGAENENDFVPSNLPSINPPPDFASFLGTLTSDNQPSRDQRSPPDTKPDTDVTFIKEEFVSEPSSCAQAGSSGQSGRSGDDLYPVMLHQNTSVFPSTSAGYPPGYPGGASATATSQHPGFPGTSTSQSDPFSPGTSQDGADPSGWNIFHQSEALWQRKSAAGSQPEAYTCERCGTVVSHRNNISRHRRKCERQCHLRCPECGKGFYRRDNYQDHLWNKHRQVDHCQGDGAGLSGHHGYQHTK